MTVSAPCRGQSVRGHPCAANVDIQPNFAWKESFTAWGHILVNIHAAELNTRESYVATYLYPSVNYYSISCRFRGGLLPSKQLVILVVIDS